jgi:hypothetical protein
MSSTTFISGTLIQSDWLNDVNTVTYNTTTGSGSTVKATSPTITTPTITTPTITVPTITGGATVSSGDVTVSTGNAFLSTGKMAIGATSSAVKLSIVSTDSVLIPVGTTLQRPTGATGYIRFNSTNTLFEGYNGTSWGSLGGGATGGAGNQVFIENDQTVTTDYTVTSNKNAGSFGPITVNTGITVTIPTGSTWSIV